MAITVKDIESSLKDSFQLKRLAGGDDLGHVVTWVHMMEDTSVVDFFWGNEIVVTSCYTVHNEEELMETLKILVSKRCCGLVINIGKYIETVPQQAIDYCNQEGLPLYTMPWHKSMTEFVRASCTMLTQSAQSEDAVAAAVLRAVNAPQDPGGYFTELSEYFDEEKGFRLLAVHIKSNSLGNSEDLVRDHRSRLRLHTALQNVGVRYLLFKDNNRVFILLNTTDQKLAEDIALNILGRLRDRFPNVPVQVGIGDCETKMHGLSDGYHSALSAQRCARAQGKEIVKFYEMGFLRILYSVPDRNLLRSYYYDTMNPLLNYDKEHGSVLAETLYRYLLTDGSLSEVAAQMYSHRNTINYRMGKIRELLGCDLSTASEKFSYLLAYHCAVILKDIKPLE